MTNDGDGIWAPLACSSREALAALGYMITNKCLPGEPDAGDCGAGNASHAVSQLTILKAITDHHLAHFGDVPWAQLALAEKLISCQAMKCPVDLAPATAAPAPLPG